MYNLIKFFCLCEILPDQLHTWGKQFREITCLHVTQLICSNARIKTHVYVISGSSAPLLNSTSIQNYINDKYRASENGHNQDWDPSLSLLWIKSSQCLSTSSDSVTGELTSLLNSSNLKIPSYNKFKSSSYDFWLLGIVFSSRKINLPFPEHYNLVLNLCLGLYIEPSEIIKSTLGNLLWHWKRNLLLKSVFCFIEKLNSNLIWMPFKIKPELQLTIKLDFLFRPWKSLKTISYFIKLLKECLFSQEIKLPLTICILTLLPKYYIIFSFIP
jgi:hypothetical protein